MKSDSSAETSMAPLGLAGVLDRIPVQLLLTSIAVNLKRMVKLLTGVSLRGEAKPYLMAG